MLILTLTAELTGVTDLIPIDTEESPFYYAFKLQCTGCRETHPNWVHVSRFESHKVTGSRGEANLVWRCKNCTVSLHSLLSPLKPPTAVFSTTAISLESPHKGIPSHLQRRTILKQAKREHSATIKEPPKAYTASSPPKRQLIIEVDCRGLELVDFKADGDFQASSSLENSSTKFPSIDLSDGEWYDYDEKAAEEVSILGIKWEIRRNV